MQTLGIIGFGAFTEFLIPYLKPYFKIKIYSRRDVTGIAKKLEVAQVSLEEVCECNIVVVGVLAQFFEKTMKEIGGMIKPGTLVMDVCSVKVRPVELMKKYLSDEVEIIGTHPLFGPQSGKDGIKGLRIVVCPVRSSRVERVNHFFANSLGLDVLVRTPEEHDRETAYSLGLTHFIGRALNEMDVRQTGMWTVAFNKLMEVKQLLGGDSYELFKTIENENPFAREVREEFCDKLLEINKKL